MTNTCDKCAKNQIVCEVNHSLPLYTGWIWPHFSAAQALLSIKFDEPLHNHNPKPPCFSKLLLVDCIMVAGD